MVWIEYSGYLATWLLGYLATWLLGYLATWLLGYLAGKSEANPSGIGDFYPVSVAYDGIMKLLY